MVNIKVAVLGGSSAETYEQKGAAHFLAAAAFAGNNKNSALRVVRYLESLGAVVKSSVDREKVNYLEKKILDFLLYFLHFRRLFSI